MKRFRIQLVIAGIVLVCGVSLMGLVYIVFNKPETYITPGIVTSNTPASESPLSNPNASVTQQTYPPRAAVHYPTKTYKGIKPVAPSSVRGLYLTSGAQVQTVGGGFAHHASAETSQSSSSRGIVYSTSGAGMPTTNFLALASQRQVAEPESQEAPQMAHLASSDPRHAPGPPDPGELPGDHQLVEHPIGDGLWCLIVLAIGYATVKIKRRNRTMTHKILLIGMAMMSFAACAAAQTPDDEERPEFTGEPSEPALVYSRELINARMSDWHNKDVLTAFPRVYYAQEIPEGAHEAQWDYVSGVVAKGILDAWEYYQKQVWADAWYKSLCKWALKQQAVDQGGILDDLNCTKVFLGLYEGAKPGGKFANEKNAAYFMEQLRRGARGLADHKARFSIAEGGAKGGWMHKASEDPTKLYHGQMWCDGAYMGPALLAQLIAVGATEGLDLGWDDVVLQFTACWPYLWDEKEKLLYHVIFTDIKTNKNARALYKAGHLHPCAADPKIYRSEEFWGRANGWFILALVDVLESMDKAGYTGAGRETLLGYLRQLADGLVARQDPKSGCWYQLLAYGSDKCATQGKDDTGSAKFTNVEAGGTQCNYLESSASCLIMAALLKGTRLGYIDHAEAVRHAIWNIDRTFIEFNQVMYSCQSAGLSADRNGTSAYYLIGKDVPIQNNTEGKALGACIMAFLEAER